MVMQCIPLDACINDNDDRAVFWAEKHGSEENPQILQLPNRPFRTRPFPYQVVKLTDVGEAGWIGRKHLTY